MTCVPSLWGAAASLALVATAGPATAQDDTSSVSVLHAVPGLTVDVYVNGEETLPDFEPGTLTDPLELPAGAYDIEVYADGAPALTAFVNDTSMLEAGQARLTVRHTAAAPAVDVRAGGEAVIEGLENPNEKVLNLEVGTVSADVTLAGTDDVVIGPADLDLAEGTNTIVYAWGSAEEGSLDLAVQSIDGLHGDPGGVPSGEAGLVNGGASTWMWVLALTGAAGALVATRRLSQGAA